MELGSAVGACLGCFGAFVQESQPISFLDEPFELECLLKIVLLSLVSQLPF